MPKKSAEHLLKTSKMFCEISDSLSKLDINSKNSEIQIKCCQKAAGYALAAGNAIRRENDKKVSKTKK